MLVHRWHHCHIVCPIIAALGLLMALPGCADLQGEDENVIVAPGKEDNFFSNVAREYLAQCDVTIELDASYKDKSDSERLDRARRVMEGKTKQIGWFLHVYLIDKSHDDEAGDYGGLRAMVLDGSYDSDGLKQDQDDVLKFSYVFRVQVGGSRSLLDKIRTDQGLADDADSFVLKMAKLSNSQVVSFSHSAYGAGDWSPDKCGGCEIESVTIKLEPIEESPDAYLDYARLLEDDVVDVSIHVGWDYHARYDITHSRTLYNWLVDTLKFKSPAESYEKYNRLSGPLTRKLNVNGREITTNVTIFRPDPCEAWDEDGSYGAWATAVKADESKKKRSCPDWKWDDPKANANPTTSTGAGNLMQDLKASMKTRDAIIFTGHSGYTYGYALASWYQTSAGDLDPPEIKTMQLPKDKSQLFVMSGCDTYHVAQAFKDNPNKLGLVNADVVTTTSFSNAGDVGDTKDLITALVGNESALLSASYGKVMKQLNPSSYDYGWGHFTMYGVHGIDDNPLRDPLSDPSKTCTVCTQDSDCGAAGNVCVRLNSDEKVCAAQCLHDKGCAADQVCRQFGSSSTGYIRGRACVPTTLSCNVAPPTPPTEKSFTASGEVKRDEEQTYTVNVGATATNVTIELTGTEDSDLYTRFDTAPSKSDYDCRPYKSSSNETCKHDQATGATLEIMVRGYSTDPAKYELKVTWD